MKHRPFFFLAAFLLALFSASVLRAQDLYVGSNSSGVTTTLSSGTNSYDNTYIGYTSTDANNTLRVVNTNTVLTNSADLYVGDGGSGNSLVISNGGQVVGSGYGYVGFDAGSSNNSVTVSGTNSSLVLTEGLFVGYGGVGNSLTITNGASVTVVGTSNSNYYLSLGETSASSGNTLTVSGASTLSVNVATNSSYGIWIGDSANSSNNAMVVSGGSKVYSGGESGLGWGSGGLNNSALITGASSLWTNNGSLTVGVDSSSQGILTVANGGSVAATTITVATNAGSTGVLNIGRLGGTDTGGTITATTAINGGGGTGTINFNQTDGVTFASTITGANLSLRQLGTGTTTLSASNTFGGTTTISNGVLTLGNTNALSGSTLDYSSAGTISFGALTGVNVGGLQGSSNLVLTNASGAAVAFNVGGNSSSTIYSGILSGVGSLGKSGSGTLILSAANTHTGGTTINAGTLQVGNGGTSGSLGSGNITNNGTLAFNRSDNITNTNVISGGGNLAKLGANTMVLSGSNSFTGTTTISAGVLALSNTNALSGSTLDYASAGTVSFMSLTGVNLGGLQGSSNLVLTNASGGTVALNVGGNGSNTTYSGVLSGTAGLTKSGAGTLFLSGLNTYGGTTTIGGGTLRVTNLANTGTSSGIGTNTNIVLTNGGTLDYAGTTNTIMNRGINLAAGNGGIGVSNSLVALTNAGVISNVGTLVKSGAGTLVLAVTNTYTGGTTLNAGTIAISNAASFGAITSTVTFASNGTKVVPLVSGLRLTNLFAVNANGTINVGSGLSMTNAGVISGTGNLTKAGAGTLSLQTNNTFSGILTLSEGVLLFSTTSSNLASATLDLSGGTLGYSGVPGVAVTLGGLQGSGNWIMTNATGSAVILQVGGNNSNTTYSGSFSSIGTVNKTGTGTLALTAANYHTGGTTNSGGTLAISNGGAFGSNSVTFATNGAGTGRVAALASLLVTNNYVLTTNGTMDVGAFILTNTGVISGAGNLTKSGGGTMVLGRANTYTGGTTLNAGTVAISSNTSFGTGTVTFASNGTTVAALNSLQVTNNYALTTNGTMDVGALILTNTGVVSGAGSLTKVGSGTLILTKSNTYTGGTTINAGTLAISNSASFGTGTVTMASNSTTVAALTNVQVTNDYALAGNGTVDVGANTMNNSGVISGAGSLTKAGAGTMILGAGNTYAGGTVINAGTLAISNGSSFSSNTVTFASNSTTVAALASVQVTNSYALTGNGTMDVGGNILTNSGVISGAGSLTKAGAGTLILGAANTYTGGTTINAGTLAISNGSSLGSNTVTFATNGAGTAKVAALASLQVTNNYALATNGTMDVGAFILTNSGVISGTGRLIKSGDGTMVLVGANTYTGGTTLNAGTLAVSSGSSLGTNAVTFASNGTTVAALASLEVSNNYVLTTNGTMDVGAFILTNSGVISGAGKLTKSGNGTMILGRTNTYTGGTTLNAGTVAITYAASLGTNTVTFASNGTTLANLSTVTNVGNMRVTNNYALAANGTMEVQESTTWTNIGVISGAGSLIKSGAGTMVLGGSNTYTGGTTLNAGTMSFTNPLAFGSNAVTFASNGAKLLFNTFLGSASVIQLDANGVMEVSLTNNFAQYGVISGSGNLIKEGAGTLTLSGTNTYTGDTIINAGTLELKNLQSLGSTDSNSVTFASNGTKLVTLTNMATYKRGGIVMNGNGTIEVGASSLLSIYGGGLSGANSLTKSGAGTLILAAHDNGFTGTTTISNGVLRVATDDALANSTLDYSSAGTIEFAATGYSTFYLGGLQGSNDLVLSNAAAAAPVKALTLSVGSNNSSTTYSGRLSGPGGLTKAGTGTLVLSASNSFSGNTTARAGELSLGNTDALGSSTLDYSNAATLTFSTLTGVNLGGLQGSGNLALTNLSGGAVALNVGGNNSNTTYAGVLRGEGSLTKAGTGTLSLGASNSYSGATVVAGGSLRAAHAGALGTNGLTVSSGASLTIAASVGKNNITNNGTVAVEAGGNLTADTLAGSGALSLSGTAGNQATFTDSSSAGTSSFSTVLSVGSISLTGNGTIAFANAYNNITASSGISISGTGNLLNIVGSWSAGTYNLLTAGTSLSASGIALTNASWTGVAALGTTYTNGRTSYVFNTNALNLFMTVNSTGTADLIWNGGASGQWNTDAANTPWTDNTGASGAFASGDNVTLGTADSTIGLSSAGITAGSVTVNNESGMVTLTNGALTAASLSKSGAGSLTLGNAVTITGAMTLISGDIIGAGGTMTAGSYAVSSGLLNLNLAGDGGLTKSGDGTVTLAGTNTYSGGTIVSAGTLRYGANDALADAGAVTVSSGTLDLGSYSDTVGVVTASGGDITGSGTLTGTSYTLSNASGSGTISAALAGSAELTKSGAGTYVLGNANSYSGNTTIDAGTLAISNGAGLGSGAVTFASNDTTVAALASVQVTNNYVLNGNGTIDVGGNILTNTGVISGAGSLTKAGAGTMILAGDNSFTGTTTVSAGQLGLDNTNALSGSTLDYSSAGTISFGTLTGVNVGGLQGSSNLVLTNASGAAVAFNVGGNNSDTTYAGALSGSGGLTKVGTGSLTLSGSSTYAGHTYLEGGTTTILGSINNSTNLYVGYTNSGNSLVISNGGTVADVDGYIGFTNTASNNSVLVTGTNSLWTNQVAGFSATAAAVTAWSSPTVARW